MVEWRRAALRAEFSVFGVETLLILRCWSWRLTFPLGWMNCNSGSLCVRRWESEPEWPHSGGNGLHVSVGRTQEAGVAIQLRPSLRVISPKKGESLIFRDVRPSQMSDGSGGALGAVGPTVSPSTFRVFHK